jgi:hypothetical protein
MTPEFEKKLFPTYEKEFLSDIPPNVKPLNQFIRSCPQYMEDAKVYLYTGWEPGTTTSLGQAMLAGCIPVASPGGGAEMVEALGHGFSYKNIDDAVAKVKLAMESDVSAEAISSAAKIFSPEMFTQRIKEIVTSRN